MQERDDNKGISLEPGRKLRALGARRPRFHAAARQLQTPWYAFCDPRVSHLSVCVWRLTDCITDLFIY